MKTKSNYSNLKTTHFLQLKTLLKSILVGLLVGVFITLYRIALTKAETFADTVYHILRNNLIFIPILFIALAIAALFIGKLKKKYPFIGGSGIPQVKGVIMGYFKQSWLGTFIAKFIGGVISVGSGLSLGREGPSIQLGACIAQGVGEKVSHSPTERKILFASGASAGLAAAFNAPLAGAMFVLEEIFKYFSPIILLSTMMSALLADFVSKTIFGMNPVFNFHIEDKIALKDYWILILLGIVVGLAGVFYNTILKKTQSIYEKLPFKNENKMLIPFFTAGVLGLTFPIVLGGGHSIINALKPETSIKYLLLILIIKFIFSMISFGSGAPGGIFFPLLVMGATIGSIFGSIAIHFLGVNQDLFMNFMVLAMVGFFTSIVRAPITGMILLLEMTGSFSNLLSMSLVAIIAYITAELMKCNPIYDYLLEKQLKDSNLKQEDSISNEKVLIQMIVHHGSIAENTCIKHLNLPESCLLVGIDRQDDELIPKGDTLLLAGDLLVFLVHDFMEGKIRQELESIIQYVE